LDVTTELPVLAAPLPSRSQWACCWLGGQLRGLKKGHQVIIMDGFQACEYLVPGAKYVRENPAMLTFLGYYDRYVFCLTKICDVL
jgi:hypothetical protein